MASDYKKTIELYRGCNKTTSEIDTILRSTFASYIVGATSNKVSDKILAKMVREEVQALNEALESLKNNT